MIYEKIFFFFFTFKILVLFGKRAIEKCYLRIGINSNTIQMQKSENKIAYKIKGNIKCLGIKQFL